MRVGALCIFVLIGSVGLARAEGALVDYVVREGDSCVTIALNVWGDWRPWKRIQDTNPNICGGQPDNLRPGMTLKLPAKLPADATASTSGLKVTVKTVPVEVAPTPVAVAPVQPPQRGAAAQVTAVLREVAVRSSVASPWNDAATGTELSTGWRLKTEDASAAALKFQDASRLDVRANTLLVVYGGSATNARRTSRARLERGALVGRLAELAGQPKLVVETEAAVTRMDGSDGLISVDDAQTCTVANHAGAPMTVEAAGATVTVPVGMGSRIVKGRKPTRPRPLPPTPEFGEGAGRATPGGPLVVTWKPVEGVERCRIEISREPDGRRPVAAARVPMERGRFKLPLESGKYYVRLSAIDADGFEGRPSAERTFAVVLNLLRPPGGTPVANPAKPVVLPGTEVHPPAGWRCGVNDAAQSGVSMLTDVGVARLKCMDGRGDTVASVNVEVVPVRSRIEDMPRRIQPGQPVTFTLRLVAPVVIPKTIRLDGPAAFNFGAPEYIEPGKYRVTMRPQGNLPRSPIDVRVGAVSIAKFSLGFGAGKK